MQATKLDPKNLRAHLGLGRIFMKEEKMEEAEKQFQLAVGLETDNPVPHLFLQRLYEKWGRDEAARSQKGLVDTLSGKKASNGDGDPD